MTREQKLMSGVAKLVFRLNGQLLALAQHLAEPVGLTAAWWQVLGAVLQEPLSVADIARRVGLRRQSVQRVADLLVANELAIYRSNPDHRRAKLFAPTEKGHATVRRIAPAHARFAKRLTRKVSVEDLSHTLEDLSRLSEALDALVPRAR